MYFLYVAIFGENVNVAGININRKLLTGQSVAEMSVSLGNAILDQPSESWLTDYLSASSRLAKWLWLSK